jgi:hypothetical protein
MTRCGWCDEEIDASAIDTLELVTPMHAECAFRSIMGSIAHIERRCSCYVKGADETDPPEMTRREAAKAALAAWEAQGNVIPRY